MGIDSKAASDPVRRRLRRLGRGERLEEAEIFLAQFAREAGLQSSWRDGRVQEVRRSLARTGHYDHSPEELAFGARVAWRNHSRCIGRLWWKSLDVVDCRHITDPDAIAAQLFSHLATAWNGGRVRSMISIFAPVVNGAIPASVESPQLLQYAGYLSAGKLLGDQQNIELTRTAIAMGWQPPKVRTAFDMLPIILRDAGGRRRLYEVPPGLVHEVEIQHPGCPAIGGLGLRWYAVPVVSDMILTIGGIDYPCAPFNGFYMSTEIASRNLSDTRRYDRLADVGEALGLDQRTDPLWKDSSLTELNRAVLHSFEAGNTSIVSHHAASDSFMEFVKLEQAEGRVPSADGLWVVPPQAASACEVFHLPMEDRHVVPNYYRSRAQDGADLTADRWLERRHRHLRRLDRLKARWRRFRRNRDWLW